MHIALSICYIAFQLDMVTTLHQKAKRLICDIPSLKRTKKRTWKKMRTGRLGKPWGWLNLAGAIFSFRETNSSPNKKPEGCCLVAGMLWEILRRLPSWWCFSNQKLPSGPKVLRAEGVLSCGKHLQVCVRDLNEAILVDRFTFLIWVHITTEILSKIQKDDRPSNKIRITLKFFDNQHITCRKSQNQDTANSCEFLPKMQNLAH